MIKQLLFCCAIPISGAVFAQPIIQSTDFHPAIGETIVNHFRNGSVPDQGAPGGNQTWDLSTMATSYVEPAIYLEPSADYPGTTISYDVSNPTAEGTFHVLQNTAGRFIYGFELFLNGSLARTYHYDDPMQTMVFPIQMGASFTDSSSCTITAGSDVYQRTGTRTVAADGYGTLITPEGTFADVIRMHFVTDDTDFHDGVPTDTYHAEGYYWYKAGFHDELAIVSSNTTNGGAAVTTGVYLEVDDLRVPSANESKVKLWPNPAKDKVTIAVDPETVAGVTVTDLQGKAIQVDVNQFSELLVLDMTGFAKGVYVVEISYLSGSSWQTRLTVE